MISLSSSQSDVSPRLAQRVALLTPSNPSPPLKPIFSSRALLRSLSPTLTCFFRSLPPGPSVPTCPRVWSLSRSLSARLIFGLVTLLFFLLEPAAVPFLFVAESFPPLGVVSTLFLSFLFVLGVIFRESCIISSSSSSSSSSSAGVRSESESSMKFFR